MKALIVGLAGMPGAGKGTVSQYLVQLAKKAQIDCHTPRFSDVPREILTTINKVVDRENLQNCVQIMERVGIMAGRGPGELSRITQQRIEGMITDITTPCLILVDGVRWPSDEKMINSFPSCCMIGVEKDQRLRYEALLGRGENANETDKTFEQFQKEDEAPNEIYVLEIISRASIEIDNNKGINDLKTIVEFHWKNDLYPTLLA